MRTLVHGATWLVVLVLATQPALSSAAATPSVDAHDLVRPESGAARVDDVLEAAGLGATDALAETCSLTFTFDFGTPGFRTFYGPSQGATVLTHEITGRPVNTGDTLIQVRNPAGETVRAQTTQWRAGFSIHQPASTAEWGTDELWTVQFQSSPFVVVESGRLDIKICWM